LKQILKPKQKLSVVLVKTLTTSDKAQEAICLVAEIFAKNVQTYSIGERTIIPTYYAIV
jgi:hypothetical protein